jgi:dTDP-4-dehydrorhamnose 3,5-epimerase
MFDEVQVIEPDIFTDYRGEIWTSYHRDTFSENLNFKHDKYSTSRRGVLRGIHGDYKTWKLVSCLYGELYFVVVDNRPESDTYLQWRWIILSDKNRKQVLLPPGFGNAFYVLSDRSLFSYKLHYPGKYSGVDEQFTIKWDDSRLGIDWPTSNPILQPRDKNENT